MSDPVPDVSEATMAYQPAEPSRPGKTMAGQVSALSIPVATPAASDGTISGYEILGELGRGGMGVVYKARQIALNRIVALKMILSGKFAAESQIARFQAEAEALAKLQHPNIVQVYDVGNHQGNAYIALEFVEGGTLAEKTQSQPQSPRASARLVELLARAMQSAHEVGIVHRDLKPVNILLQPFVLGDVRSSSGSTSRAGGSQLSKSNSKQSIMTHVSVEYGTPKISDFGLAKQEEGAASGMTNAGSIMGTPSYMSPEQAIGDVGLIGPATDIYTLGAILYEMLTGRPPFRADTPVNTIMQVIRGEVVPPSRLVAKLPRDLETITLKCLEKSPHKRYPSAAAFADDLENYLEDRPITARPVGPMERLVKWVHRRPLIASLIGAILLGLLSFIILGIYAYAAVTERARAAELAREEANAAAAESKKRLIRLAVANGAQLLDRSEVLGAAGWFAEALKLDDQNPAAELIHRKRIAAALSRSPILAHLWQHEAAVNDIVLSADGNLLASGGNDGLIRIWTLSDGKPLQMPIEHGSTIAALDFSPDATELLVLSQDGACKVWRLGDKVEHRVLGQGLAHARFSPDGKTILAIGKPGGLVVYRRSDLSQLSTMMANQGSVAEVAISRDSLFALAPSRDGYVRWWDLKNGTLKVPPMKQGSPAVAISLHPEGLLAASGGEDGSAWLWNLQTGELALPTPWKHDAGITQVQFSPDGKYLATASEDKQCIVWDVATSKQYSPRMKHGSKVTKIAFSPDGRWLATIAEDNFARIWDIRTGRLVVSPFRHNGTPQTFRFTPHGRGLFTAGHDQLLRHWILPNAPAEDNDFTTFRTVAASILSTQSRLLTSPDGKLAANYGGDQPVRIRTATTREPLGPALKTGGTTSAVAFSKDSTWLATGGQEGTVQVWSSQEGTARWTHTAQHTSRVYVMAFHPQGTMLATGSDDNTVRCWNAETGEPLFAPIRHEGGVYWLSFSTDGTTLCSASIDGSTRVWDATTGEPITPKLPAWTGEPWKDDLNATMLEEDELLTLTQALTGMQVDQQGGMTLLDARAIMQRYQKVQDKSEQTRIPKDDLPWHENQAEQAEKAGHWFAAAWQLERLTRIQPASVEYRQRLAKAWGQLGAWQRVVEASTKILQTNPVNIEAWVQRGRAYGELKEWQRSIQDIAQATRLQQQPEWKHVMPALMQLSQGNEAGYQRACEAMLSLDKLDPAQQRTALIVLLARPLPAPWLEKIKSLFAEQLASTSASIEQQLLQAAILIRTGETEKGRAKLESLTDPDPRRFAWQALSEKLTGKPFANTLEQAKQAVLTSAISWQENVLLQELLKEVAKP